MEIVVKTATEFRDAHVTIDIRADQAEVPEISRRLTEGRDEAEAMDYMLIQAERVPALEAQVMDLRNELAVIKEVSVKNLMTERDIERSRADALEAERDALLLKSEKDRAEDHDLVMAARAERDALLLKVKSMESDLSEYAEGLDNAGDQIRSLEAERDLHKQEREENRAWAERAEAMLEVEVREWTEARKKLADVRAFLADPTRPHAARVSNALTALG